MNTPRVTVLMPVYNGERYLRDAMESILGQTFTDFEFLVINDGSTDNSIDIIASYSDPRIHLIHNADNLGLIASLNRGIKLAKGDYIVRMDCDDISLPMRLAKQVEFMDRHQDVGICGSWHTTFGAGAGHTCRLPTNIDEMRVLALFNSVLSHPTTCIRRSVLLANNLFYDPDYRHAEDYDLWTRALGHCHLANIPEVLLYYRIHAGQVTQNHTVCMRDSSNRVRTRFLREMGVDPTEEELTIHEFLGSPCVFLSAVSGVKEFKSRLVAVDRWLCKLSSINRLSRTYPEPLFTRILLWHWLILWHLIFVQHGIGALRLLRGVGIQRMTKFGWFGLVPTLLHKGTAIREEIRYQRRISRGDA